VPRKASTSIKRIAASTTSRGILTGWLPTRSQGGKALRNGLQTAGGRGSQSRSPGLQRRRFGAISMAFVALAALGQRRWDYDSRTVMCVEAVLGLIIVSLGYLLTNRHESRNGESGVADTGRAAPPNAWPTACVSLAVMLPWLVDFVARRMGYGNGNEILMLDSLAWGALAGAFVARLSKTISLSVICSGFLTLFTTFIADSSWATWFAYVWIGMCLWWLVANHWESVELTDASSVQSMHSVGLIYLALGLLTFIGTTAVVSGRIPVLRKLQAEVMPTSGGTTWNDSAARSGVGSGDLLIAARQHASSFGAVDTDFFLDSEKPSLYDVFSDEFGEPRRKFRVERAQSLSPQETRSEEGRFAEANRSSSGGEFSTDRDRPRLTQTPRDLTSNALMFWEGEAGVRLAVERYPLFDGVVWRQIPIAAADKPAQIAAGRPLPLELGDRTWFQPPARYHGSRLSEHAIYVDRLPEAIKFTRFRSAAIPTRAGMQLWSIDQITLPELFSYGVDDCLFMPGRLHVPDYTVVRFINSRIDVERADHLLSEPRLALPTLPLSVSCTTAIDALRKHYIADKPRGWSQVAAIIAGLRREFRLAPQEEISINAQTSINAQGRLAGANSGDDGLPTPLETFLERRRGPSYLFATTAAMLLESAGYKTRLVSGFYVNPRHYLAGDNEYAIQPSDAHVWLEVEAGPGAWIPLEPTPGYRQPRYKASLWYSIAQARGQIIRWSLSIAFTVCFVLYFRTRLLDLLCWLCAPLVELVPDRKRIVWLGRLLDLRLRWTGYSRPVSRVPRTHFRPLYERLPEGLRAQLQNFLDLSDSICFGGLSQLTHEQRRLVRQLWNELNCSEIRKATAEQRQVTTE
jgi:protein-glutamine gamma-glutamyltransferase